MRRPATKIDAPEVTFRDETLVFRPSIEWETKVELNNQRTLGTKASDETPGRRSNPDPNHGVEDISRIELDQHVESLRKALNPGESSDKETLIERGRLIVQCLYKGDLGAWRRHGPREPKFRVLAKRANLPLPVTQLCQAVTLYELFDRLPKLISDPHVTLRYIDVITRVPKGEQMALLKCVVEGRWSLRRLRNHVFGTEPRHPTRGRPKHAAVLKTLNAITRLTPGAFEDNAALRELPTQSARDYELALERHIAECQQLLTTLSALT